MTGLPAPAYVARAIAEALTPKAIAAHAYLAEHASMLAAGVPVEHVRAVLDVAPVDSPCVLEARRWNGRGCMLMCGSLGVGKTYAAAMWLLEQVRAGLSVHWINAVDWAELDLDGQRELVTRSKRVRALVIDDLGAGTTGPRGHRGGKPDWYHQQLEGVLMGRAEKPTMVLSNFNQSEMAKWVGPRLLDRSRVCGALMFIEGTSRRTSDGPSYDGDGLGVAWHQARGLVEQLGVRPASSWSEALSADVWRFDVGEQLESVTLAKHRFSRSEVARELSDAVSDDARAVIELGARAKALRACAQLAREHGLDGEDLRVQALALEASDPAVLLMPVLVAALHRASVGSVRRAGLTDAEWRRKDTARLSAQCYEALEDQVLRLRGDACASTVCDGDAPPWTEGAEGLVKMRELGYRLRQLGRGRGYEITQRERMVIPAHALEADAWQSLRRLLGAGF